MEIFFFGREVRIRATLKKKMAIGMRNAFLKAIGIRRENEK